MASGQIDFWGIAQPRRVVLRQLSSLHSGSTNWPLQHSLHFASTYPTNRDSSAACVQDSIQEHTHSRRTLLASILLVGLTSQAKDVGAATSQQSVEGGATILVTSADLKKFSLNERQLLDINKRVQKQNNVPREFPNFIRNGFDIKVVADTYSAAPNGLIYKDYEPGSGDVPLDGQEVEFNYTAYNENGSRIDSSFQKGRPSKTRLGIKGLIPGFEDGIKSMRVGGRRRVVVPPELGPPVGPSTFFSAKQCEVFDIELLNVRNCRRRQVAMFSDVVCE